MAGLAGTSHSFVDFKVLGQKDPSIASADWRDLAAGTVARSSCQVKTVTKTRIKFSDRVSSPVRA
ncbi:MAG: hypothetical protein CMK09_09665 [Ponticaulis sp.]|nr:hypothetical protein [Ponticaulis sp.]